MKRAWQEVAPPAWQTAVQHSNDGDSDAVITAVLLSQIPGMDAKVETAATADAIPAGAVANAGAGGDNKKNTKNCLCLCLCLRLRLRLRLSLSLSFLLLLFLFLFFPYKQIVDENAEIVELAGSAIMPVPVHWKCFTAVKSDQVTEI